VKLLRWITNPLARTDDQTKALWELRPTINEAHSLLAAQNYEKAREVLLPAVKLRDRVQDGKTIDWILTSLASTWLFQDRFEEQIAFFADYISHHPNDCAAYRERAAALWYSGKLREAVEDYSHAIKLEPTDLQSRSGRGQVLAELRENEEAIEDLDIALGIVASAPRPNDSWCEWKRHTEAFIRNGRAVALAGLRKLQEAMAEFETSISLSPNNAWVYYNRAQVHDHLGDQEKAAADYRMSLAKNGPPLAPLQRERATAYLADKR
jgi:tetratricopeptide (TPR) repeat protein